MFVWIWIYVAGLKIVTLLLIFLGSLLPPLTFSDKLIPVIWLYNTIYISAQYVFNLYTVFSNTTWLQYLGLYTYCFFIGNTISDENQYRDSESRVRAFEGLAYDMLCVLLMTFAFKVSSLPLGEL